MTSPPNQRAPLNIVPDEWLLHDLWGENGEARQEETAHFMERVVLICDRFVLRRPSPFLEKTQQLVKMAAQDPRIRRLSKFFHLRVLRDPRKAAFVDEVQSVAPSLLDGVKDDDRYLVEALTSTRDAILVTTDNTLAEWLRAKKQTVLLRDEFLPKYLGTSPSA